MVRVTVIGAGIVGCAVAHELARRGARVQLVDEREPGMGATQASAGILAPFADRHSPELARLCRTSLAMYDAFMERVQADSGRTVEYDRNGTVQVALGELHEAELEAMAAELAALGIAHTPLTAAGVRRAEPHLSTSVRAGLLVPSDGYVSALPLAASLAEAALRQGADVVRERVLSIEGGASGARIRTAHRTNEADTVVVTTGSWASQLVGTDGPTVRPIRGQILRLRPAGRVASRVIWGERCYAVPWRDGSVLLGATVEDVGFDERSTPEGVAELRDAAAEMLPALADATLEEVRVGLRPRGSREMPFIGRLPSMPNVVVAVGHYRNGVILSPLTAALVADLILDGRERDELALTRPERPLVTHGTPA